jgi:hypothetical protein
MYMYARGMKEAEVMYMYVRGMKEVRGNVYVC